MERGAFDISISLQEHLFNFKPLDCFNVDRYIIIMYQLIHTFKGKILKSAIIPYYVSDGKTNRLNADMLFPFVCFTDRVNDPPICPYSLSENLNNFGLLKYKVTKNMDTYAIEASVNKSFSQEKLKELLDSSKNRTVGITSIFVRIENVLDFIICCSSEKLRAYNPEQILNFAPLGILLPNENEYRKCVLDQLHKMIQSLEDTKVVTFTKVMLGIQRKTYDEFNSIINICGKQDAAQHNVYNYKHISNKLYELLFEFNTSTEKFPYLLTREKVTLLKENKELNETLNQWWAYCSPKAIDDIIPIIVGVKKTPAHRIFEQIEKSGKIVFVNNFKTYTPIQKEIVNDLFFEKITEFLSSKSLDESLKLIDSHIDFLSPELYERLITTYSAQVVTQQIMESLSFPKKGMRKRKSKRRYAKKGKSKRRYAKKA